MVDINLLPQRDPKPFAILLITGLSAIIILLAIGFMYTDYMFTKKTVAEVKQEIDRTVALREASQADERIETGDSFNQLFNRIESIKKIKYPSVPLLDNFTELLPERGYFMNYGFEDDGLVKLSVQFDTIRETSQYLYALNQSPFVKDVQIKSVITADLDSDEISTELEGYELNLEENSEEKRTSLILPRYLAEYEISIDKVALKTKEATE
ncbi:PilN domain-containing protein [Pseudalkalibacillus caeni]|uniref:PilN domain-containing protein n=1 Tax=Exobacillus caeni TaxID=2574798 RepID=A0A5R9F6M9_9BACL|nr:PilN domain-containing protein [Pseudalkalibacillus caeni]TLS39237.1 PilN domain-containing protein [Pseudalkalibacillus caeni]